MSDEEPPPRPQQQQPWLDLERFRSARAFSQGGCALPALLVIALTVRLF